MNEQTEMKMRIGHDDYVFSFLYTSSQFCGCIIIDAGSLEVELNKEEIDLSGKQKKKVAFLLEFLCNLKSTFTYSKMEESGIRTAVFLKDLADMMEKYYKVQIGLVVNPPSAKGEMETRKFEDFIRDVAMDLALVKEEVDGKGTPN